jgi:TRAP-type C4-dicarboxylate transport system substrate-binding protein
MTDVLKYHTFLSENNDYAGIGNMMQGFICNKGVWDSIPPEYQAVIKEELAWAADAQAYNNDNMIQTGIKYMEERGNEIIRLTPEEAQLWYDAANVSLDEWVEQAVNEGGMGEEEARALCAKLTEAIKNKEM